MYTSPKDISIDEGDYMNRERISIYDSRPGMAIAESIYNEFGAVVIIEGTILDRQTIDRIEGMGVLEIEVVTEKETKSNDSEDLDSRYRQNVKDISDIMNDLREGLALDMQKINKIADTISSGLYSHDDIVGKLSRHVDPDEYINTHSINVSVLAMTLGKWMGCSEDTVRNLILAGLLHDIGKSKIPLEVINKPEGLDPKEFVLIEQHPKYAFEILEDVDGIDNEVLLGILTHHEREDGSGYPLGITSEKINLIGKILAIVDIFDAMTSERHYRKKQSPFEVFKQMQNDSFGRLHPVILNKFVKNMAQSYMGAVASLTNGQRGQIVFINNNKISKPIININGELVDLSLESGLKIESIVIKNKIL